MHTFMPSARRTMALFAFAFCGFWMPSARAWDADYFSYIADSNMNAVMLNNISNSAGRYRELVTQPRPGNGRAGRTAMAASTVVPVRWRTPFAAQAAARYPAASRARVEQELNALLAAYAGVERHFGVPRGDVAGAVATFLLGNYAVYHGTSLDDASFRPLAAQVRATLAASPVFRNAPLAQRQALYEQTAIVGMLMLKGRGDLKARPRSDAAATLKPAARAYLEGFLRVDIERLRITTAGLQLR